MDYAKTCQSLLEDPIQLVTVITLMLKRVLPSPLRSAVAYQERFGLFFGALIPSVSMLLSFGSIVGRLIQTFYANVKPQSFSTMYAWTAAFFGTTLYREGAIKRGVLLA